jgi:fatty acid desaturase
MDDEDEEGRRRPDWYRYAAPDPRTARRSREWVYVLLALVVVGLMALIVTGVVRFGPGG